MESHWARSEPGVLSCRWHRRVWQTGKQTHASFIQVAWDDSSSPWLFLRVFQTVRIAPSSSPPRIAQMILEMKSELSEQIRRLGGDLKKGLFQHAVQSDEREKCLQFCESNSPGENLSTLGRQRKLTAFFDSLPCLINASCLAWLPSKVAMPCFLLVIYQHKPGLRNSLPVLINHDQSRNLSEIALEENTATIFRKQSDRKC